MLKFPVQSVQPAGHDHPCTQPVPVIRIGFGKVFAPFG